MEIQHGKRCFEVLHVRKNEAWRQMIMTPARNRIFNVIGRGYIDDDSRESIPQRVAQLRLHYEALLERPQDTGISKPITPHGSYQHGTMAYVFTTKMSAPGSESATPTARES
jgi:hypothetical protein